MTVRLFFQAMGKFLAGLLTVALILFLSAGTLRYWNGWLLIAILFVPMFIAGIVMMFRNPELLKKRLHAKEKEKEQKSVIALSGLMFLTAFVLAGLNFRFRWIVLPDWLVIAAAAVFLAAYLMYAEVLRENAYLSRTVEVQEGQKVPHLTVARREKRCEPRKSGVTPAFLRGGTRISLFSDCHNVSHFSSWRRFF